MKIREEDLIDSLDRINSFISYFGIKLIYNNGFLIGRNTEDKKLLDGFISIDKLELAKDVIDLEFESEDKKYTLCRSFLSRGLGLTFNNMIVTTKKPQDGKYICDDCTIPFVYFKYGFKIEHTVSEINSNGDLEKGDKSYFFINENAIFYASKKGVPENFKVRYNNEEKEYRRIIDTNRGEENGDIVSSEEINEYMSKIDNSDLINSIVKENLPEVYKRYSKEETKLYSLNMNKAK